MSPEAKSSAPLAVQDALAIAPHDPWKNGKVPNLARELIGNWIKPSGKKPDDTKAYEALMEPLSPNEKAALRLYLATTAIGIARMAPLKTNKLELEAHAFHGLVSALDNSKIEKSADVEDSSWKAVFSINPDIDISASQSGLKPANKEFTLSDQKAIKKVRQTINSILDSAAFKDKPMTMRTVRAIVEAVKAKVPKAAHFLFDLSLGDIDLTGEMEKGFENVPEALGLSGIKEQRIDVRAIGYRELLKRSGQNPTGYEPRATGLPAIHDWFERYLKQFGLKDYVRGNKAFFQSGPGFDGSYMAYGGADGMKEAYSIARKVLRYEKNKQKYVPTTAFFTPGFMMMEDIAKNIGVKTVQAVTDPMEHFQPTGEQIRKFLENNPDVDIIVLTPINNPASYISEANRIKGIVDVLKEFEQNGRQIILINDLAYLGTGNRKLNRQMGVELNKYQRRIDVLSLSKIAGEPGLRACCGLTPDPQIAQFVEDETKKWTLAMSYPAKLRLLSKLDLVSFEDLQKVMKLYQFRQDRLLNALATRPDLFDLNDVKEEDVLEDSKKKGNKKSRNAGLYLWVKLKKGITAKDIIRLGLMGTAPDAFYFTDTEKENVPNYIRFAIGKTPMTDEVVKRLKIALASPNS